MQNSKVSSPRFSVFSDSSCDAKLVFIQSFFHETIRVILRPVIERELRVTARQWFTYTLRIMGTAAAVAVCAVATLKSSSTEGAGGRVFGYVHLTQFCAIWILVPLLTADCLSRER